MFAKEIYNGRVNEYADNSNLIDFWNNQGGKNIDLPREIKNLFSLSLTLPVRRYLVPTPSTKEGGGEGGGGS